MVFQTFSNWTTRKQMTWNLFFKEIVQSGNAEAEYLSSMCLANGNNDL